MLDKVLVPLDGSSLAEQAIEYALRVVSTGGKLTLLMVLHNPDFPVYDFYPMTTAVMQNYDKAVNEAVPRAKEYLNQLAEGIQTKHQVAVSVVVEAGEPAEVIVETAEKSGAEAIVMSTHGRSGINRWLFGSITSKVLASSATPIFVVPAKHIQKRKTAELAAVKANGG
jgi:nucleotide-binding universal stress UspA family protein